MITSQTHANSPLWTFIDQRATDNRSAVEKAPPPPFPGADYWLLASLLQKAIRRGDFANARRAAHQLYETDPHRLWRRLMVIALEDIGIGDPAVLVQMVALAVKPRWREDFGGDLAVLDRLLAESCSAVKDRSGDHIASLVSEGHPEPFPKAPPVSSRSVLLTTVTSPSLPTLTRLDAAVRAANMPSGLSKHLIVKFSGLEALFGVYREMDCPPLLVEACKTYVQKSDDLLPLVIPLVWAVWRETGAEPGSTRYDVGFADLGDGMPSYAFDPLHTRPGKRAVAIWLKSYSRLPWDARQVSAALWNIDAAACDRTLTWAEGNKLRRLAYRADLLRAEVPIDQCSDLMAWVRQEHPALVTARRIVWHDMQQQASPNQPPKHINPHLPVSKEGPSHG